MKIAMIVPGGVDRSGEQRVIPALLSLLRRLAPLHEVHVFALAQERSPARWMLEGAHIHNIGGGGGLPRVARTIAAVLRENRSGRFDLVQSIWSDACGLAATCSARLLNVPSSIHYAGGELEALPGIAYGGRSNWKGRMRESFVLRTATVVTAASAPMIQRIAELGRRAELVPLGVDLHAWPPRSPVRRTDDEELRLVHVASLNLVKDQSTLLRAMAVLMKSGERFHLDVVGEDTLAGRMQLLAVELGLGPRVTFHGFVPQRQLRPLIERAHLNVISSRHEAGPLVVLEAAVSGVPTAGTVVGHMAEWDPEAASCVPVGDAPALAEAIRALAQDEVLRLRIATEAQRRALACDADRTCEQFMALHRCLVVRDAAAGDHGD